MTSTVRAVIAVRQDQSLDSLAAMADKIVENGGHQEIAAVVDSPLHTSSQGSIVELAGQVDKLRLEVPALRGEVCSRGRTGSRSRANSRNSSSSRRRKGPGDPK